MDTQKATAEFRMSQWAKIIQARLDSGQKCLLHNKNVRTPK